MGTGMGKRILSRLTLTVAACAFLLGSFGAQATGVNVLLNIDVVSPDTITISTTGNFSDIDDSFGDSYYGVTLLGLFAGNASDNFFGAFTSDLVGGGSGEAYNAWNLLPGDEDLNLYNENFDEFNFNFQEFSDESAAFSGSATITIGLTLYNLLVNGPTMGNIIAGDGDGGASDLVIGKWAVSQVPLPAAAWFFLTALTGLFVARGRRTTAAA